MKGLTTLLGAITTLHFSAAHPTLSTRQSESSNPTPKKVVTFADAFSGNFTVQRTTLQWTSQGEDGSYVDADANGNLNLANIVTGESTVFVNASHLAPAAKDFYDYSIHPSGDHVLFIANYTKQYRHSYFADYYVYSVADKSTMPLVEDQQGDVQYATWSPVNNTIAYVRGNNLYIWQDGLTTQITKDGSPDVFNAVPDWVYEEEIFGDRHTLWFSPDGEELAFLRFDETGVETFSIPHYLGYPGGDTAPPYPKDLDIRYPKVGTTNPTVTFHLLSINGLTEVGAAPRTVEFEAFAQNDTIIGEVAWVTDDHSHVIFRAFNRVQDQEKLVLVDVLGNNTSNVRERDARPGWIDNNLAIQYIPGTDSYVDLSDESGWNHLYLYSVNSLEPTAITTGEWEVTAVLNIDSANQTIYYQSTERDSTERHVYSISLDGTSKTALVDDSEPGSWTASFSAGGGYYILSYNGPGLPYQELYNTSLTISAMETINNNTRLESRLSDYILPKITWSTIDHPDGYSFNIMERLPPNFDSSKQYPVVFDIYGGPGSQQTAKTFRQVDFRTYLSSDPELEYIILSVDNRGTGYKGRDYRTIVSGQLGKVEAEDQIYAAAEYAKRPYVDANHIAIMGWSYGGYLSSKVLEAQGNSSNKTYSPFSFALITAPVSDWRFYDSMYTERYMKTPETNEAGYNESSVRNVAGFKDVAGGFLIQHGTGDDNVHFQNGAVLADTLTVGGVGPSKMHVQWFTDSDHSIKFHGASGFVYRQMAQYLFTEKNRGDEVVTHQFDRRALKSLE